MRALILFLIMLVCGCSQTTTPLAVPTASDAQRQVFQHHLALRIKAEHGFSVSPMFRMTVDSERFGPAGTPYWEVRRTDLHDDGNIDGLFWVNANTGDVLELHPRRIDRTPPPAAKPATTLLTEPAVDSGLFGRVYTIDDMSRLSPIDEVKIDCGPNADWAQKNGQTGVTPANLERLLTSGRPIAPGDKVIDSWHYAPWCQATFVSGGRTWHVDLYLGGRGILTDDSERKGVFDFIPPSDSE
jgi:hypothetical protein